MELYYTKRSYQVFTVHVSCTKEMRKNETHNKFESSQPVFQETLNKVLNVVKPMGNFNRFNRCFLTHTNFLKHRTFLKGLGHNFG